MPIPFRSDLEPFLREFITEHRGLRLGTMFGLPAGYVGRRLFACLLEDGLLVRLPTDIATREVSARRAQPYSDRRRVIGAWVMYRPRDVAAARRLAPVLELSARHVAERQTLPPEGGSHLWPEGGSHLWLPASAGRRKDMTGVKLRTRR